MKAILLLFATCVLSLAAPAPETATNQAKPATTNFWKQTHKGPHVRAYYEGRSPCGEIRNLLNVPGHDDCIKIKWQLILFQDPVTHAPTTYALGGFLWRNPPKTGKWTIAKGTKEDPNAVVYQLDPDQPHPFLSFTPADENILLFIGKDRELLVGNAHFSYTLNRIADKQ